MTHWKDLLSLGEMGSELLRKCKQENIIIAFEFKKLT
jgi:hypothetical protein